MWTGTAMVVKYWEAILKQLHIYKAKACLKEIHAKMLRKHLQRLEQALEGAKFETDLDSMHEAEVIEHNDDDAGNFSPEPILEKESQESEEEAGSFSPELLHGDGDEEAIDPDKDRAECKRIAVLEDQQRRIQEAMASMPTPSEDNFELKAMKTMGAMEERDVVFGSGAEHNLDSQVYWWHDKYRPRKPKYFNCVHTGYEWNKYNQTHYDHDNPPPKIVQGYKFNIFYPYLAFIVVNKEWEYSHKKGFKCTFERGILHAVLLNFFVCFFFSALTETLQAANLEKHHSQSFFAIQICNPQIIFNTK
ncbi:Cactin [Citrus sinensis]|nr:Cactin [Citrus sinensis]